MTPHFMKRELACPHCGEAPMPSAFLYRLETARLNYGKGIIAASVYRCPVHNATVGGVKDSTHVGGWAIDPRRPAGGEELMRMIKSFLGAGFHRFGMGNRDRSDCLHFDCDPDRPPAAWMY